MKTPTSYPKHHRAVALDLAERLGWATLDKGILECGMERFQRRTGRKNKEDEHEGIQFSRMEIWIWKLLKELEPSIVFYEEAGAFQNVLTARKPYAYRGLLLACCARLSIPVMGVHIQTVKKYATGSVKASKEDMIHAVNQKYRMLDVQDDNTADAIHILNYGMSVKYQLETF